MKSLKMFLSFEGEKILTAYSAIITTRSHYFPKKFASFHLPNECLSVRACENLNFCDIKTSEKLH